MLVTKTKENPKGITGICGFELECTCLLNSNNSIDFLRILLVAFISHFICGVIWEQILLLSIRGKNPTERCQDIDIFSRFLLSIQSAIVHIRLIGQTTEFAIEKYIKLRPTPHTWNLKKWLLLPGNICELHNFTYGIRNQWLHDIVMTKS